MMLYIFCIFCIFCLFCIFCIFYLHILCILHNLHILYMLHILHNLHNNTPIVISFPKTYSIIGVSASPFICLCLCICLCICLCNVYLLKKVNKFTYGIQGTVCRYLIKENKKIIK